MKKTTNKTETTVSETTKNKETVMKMEVNAVVVNQDSEQMTKQYVDKINEAFDKSTESWVSIGQMVAEFVEIQKQKGIKEDACNRLSENPEIRVSGQMLRFYYNAYLLRQIVGTEIKVSLTHWIAVLSHDIELSQKRLLLKKAENGKWSVVRLKQEVCNNTESIESKNSTAKPTKNGKKVIKPKDLVTMSANLVNGSQAFFKDNKINAVPDDIKSVLKANILVLTNLAIKQNILTREEILKG